MSTRYAVTVEPFAERHFIKSFEKKHKNAWVITRETIIRELESVEVLFQKAIAETIIDSPGVKICKMDFRIAGSQESRKSSGNRIIISIDKAAHCVRLLFLYGKTDIRGSHETAWWKEVIKENYPEYKDLL